MTQTLAQLQATALSLGVDLTEDGAVLEAWSPVGSVFAANGGHCIVVCYEFTDVPWPQSPKLIPGTKADCRADMGEQLAMGLEPCANPDCDTCTPPLLP